MQFNIFLSKTTGKKNAVNFPNKATISSLDDLLSAALKDHTAVHFKDHKRNNKNFISCDNLIMDVDNDHSDNPDDWVNPENVKAQFPFVFCYIVYSRNHMKQKGNLSPRPRFHVYFPLREAITNNQKCRAIKEQLISLFPYFDDGAKDASRFIFGVDNPNGEVIDGKICIDEFLSVRSTQIFLAQQRHKSPELIPSINQGINQSDILTTNQNDAIQQGSRNTECARAAWKYLHRFGDTRQAKLRYMQVVIRCEPPLEKHEYTYIYEHARQKFCSECAEQGIDPVNYGKDAKIHLTQKIVEDNLRFFGCSIKLNVMTNRIEVKNVPSQNLAYAYEQSPNFAKKANGFNDLVLALTPILRDAGYVFSADYLSQCLESIANINSYNPVKDMLTANKWDKKDRLHVLHEILHIQDKKIYQNYLRKWLHQTVAMALNDEGNTSCDLCLTLQGKQGIGKTRFFQKIAIKTEWILDGAIIDMRDKDKIIAATSRWIVEIGELEETTKKEQANLKSFITSPFSRYRVPYGKSEIERPRRTSFCATVNPDEFLYDNTGSRRFAVIPVEDIDIDKLNSLNDDFFIQLWRQVYETLYIPDNTRQAFRLTRKEHAIVNSLNSDRTVKPEGYYELQELFDLQAPKNEWKWHTATEAATILRNYQFEAQKLGTLLTMLCSEKFIEKKTSNGKSQYRLPPIR